MGEFKSALKQTTNDLFSIDRRSLAAFRVGLALLLIVDLINRIPYIRDHYTDAGVLPREVVRAKISNWYHFSPYFFSGEMWLPILLFAITGLVAIGLLVGYRTRLMSVLAWVLVISLHSRNFMVLQGGDVLFRMLFFWAMFVPLGACFSVDSALNKSEKKPPQTILSMGTAALLLQACFVYWFTAAMKTGVQWWGDASAVYYALSLDQFLTPVGKYILAHPDLMRFLTRFTIWAEILLPTLAFFSLVGG